MTASDLITALTRTPGVGSLTGLFDMETVEEWLDPVRYVPASALMHKHTYRTNIRALAAILPERTLYNAAVRVHAVLQNPELSVTDVQDMLRGFKYEAPFKTIQAIGAMLLAGEGQRSIARTLGVDRETVARIDHALGITTARSDKLICAAITDLAEGDTSVRKFMTKHGVSQWEARQFLSKAREVQQTLA